MAVFWSISPVKLFSETISFMGYLGNNSVLRTEIALRGWNLRDLKIPSRFGHYFSIASYFLGQTSVLSFFTRIETPSLAFI